MGEDGQRKGGWEKMDRGREGGRRWTEEGRVGEDGQRKGGRNVKED